MRAEHEARLARLASDLRLLVLDIDGTCVDAAGEISPAVHRALRLVRRRGLALAVATGRAHQSAVDFHELTGSTLPLISYDGALLKPRAGPGPLRRWPLDPALARAVLELLGARPWRGQVAVYAHVSGAIFASQLSEPARAMAERRGMHIERVGDLARAIEGGVEHLSLISSDRRVLVALRGALEGRLDPERLRVSQLIPLARRGLLLSLSPARADKGLAVAYLAQEVLGLEPRHVAAIGDGRNDLGMLRYAGLAIAMGQAGPEVKAVADAVAPSIEQDGAAMAIEALLG